MRNKTILLLSLITSVMLSGCLAREASSPATNTTNASSTGSTTTANAPPRLPEFPWPPKASTFTKIPPQYVVEPGQTARFKDVASRLESALRSAGYGQPGYYSIPGGFVLVSQLEQFKSTGLPADAHYRWLEQVQPPRLFSLDYFFTLIQGKVGRYRVIVFAVSPDIFSQAGGEPIDHGAATRLAIEGANSLPEDVGSQPYTDNYICSALIYEFEKSGPDKPAEFKENSTLLAESHLQHILPFLKR